VGVPERWHAIGRVDGVHFESGSIRQKPWTDELVVQSVVPQDVADVLAEEAFDALAKFLDPIDVRLTHAPGTVRRVGRACRERRDRFFHLKIPRDVSDEILDERKRAHRLDCDRLVGGQRTQPRHTHQLRAAVDLRRAGAALPGLAVPSHGEIRSLCRLYLVDGVEHDHAGNQRHGVIAKTSTRRPIASPDLERRRAHFC
jgi:hypothetical protein